LPRKVNPHGFEKNPARMTPHTRIPPADVGPHGRKWHLCPTPSLAPLRRGRGRRPRGGKTRAAGPPRPLSAPPRRHPPRGGCRRGGALRGRGGPAARVFPPLGRRPRPLRSGAKLGVGHKCHFRPCGPTSAGGIRVCGVIRAGFFSNPCGLTFRGNEDVFSYSTRSVST